MTRGTRRSNGSGNLEIWVTPRTRSTGFRVTTRSRKFAWVRAGNRSSGWPRSHPILNAGFPNHAKPRVLTLTRNTGLLESPWTPGTRSSGWFREHLVTTGNRWSKRLREQVVSCGTLISGWIREPEIRVSSRTRCSGFHVMPGTRKCGWLRESVVPSSGWVREPGVPCDSGRVPGVPGEYGVTRMWLRVPVVTRNSGFSESSGIPGSRPYDGQRNCPKHIGFYSKNEFEELSSFLDLFKEYITMHGPPNVKFWIYVLTLVRGFRFHCDVK